MDRTYQDASAVVHGRRSTKSFRDFTCRGWYAPTVPINRRLLAAVLCGAFVLAGCTSTPPAPPAWEEHAATDSLGDLRTIDYCSLLDTPKILGTANPSAPAVSSFELCRVWVTEGTSRYVLVVGPLGSQVTADMQPHNYAGTLPAGVSVRDSTRGVNSCTRYLVFDDGTTLMTAASDASTPDPELAPLSREALCAKADASLAGVVAAITEKRIGRLTFEPGSFGALDPCALLTGPEADKLIGADKAATPAVHGHDCTRGDAAVYFTVGDPSALQASGNRGPQPDTIAGRSVTADSHLAACWFTASRKTSTGQVEEARVEFKLNLENLGFCDSARSLAELILPKLP